MPARPQDENDMHIVLEAYYTNIKHEFHKYKLRFLDRHMELPKHTP